MKSTTFRRIATLESAAGIGRRSVKDLTDVELNRSLAILLRMAEGLEISADHQAVMSAMDIAWSPSAADHMTDEKLDAHLTQLMAELAPVVRPTRL